MASITPVSARSESVCAAPPTGTAAVRQCAGRLLLCLIAFGFALLRPLPAHAEDFTVGNLSTELNQQVYQLRAHIDYRLSEEVLRALNNGVPITLRLDIEVKRVRHWWLNATVATLEQRYQLTYHAFSEQYLVRNLNSDALYTYPTLGMAIDALGTVRGLPLLDAKFIQPDNEYQVELRSSLDIEALPAPLRPIAYITPAWRLSSDWHTCSLKP